MIKNQLISRYVIDPPSLNQSILSGFFDLRLANGLSFKLSIDDIQAIYESSEYRNSLPFVDAEYWKVLSEWYHRHTKTSILLHRIKNRIMSDTFTSHFFCERDEDNQLVCQGIIGISDKEQANSVLKVIKSVYQHPIDDNRYTEKCITVDNGAVIYSNEHADIHLKTEVVDALMEQISAEIETHFNSCAQHIDYLNANSEILPVDAILEDGLMTIERAINKDNADVYVARHYYQTHMMNLVGAQWEK